MWCVAPNIARNIWVITFYVTSPNFSVVDWVKLLAKITPQKDFDENKSRVVSNDDEILFSRVAQHEAKNKMSLHNLATVFGPTLLRPAAKEAEPATLEMFSAQARDAMTQTGILLHYLNAEAGDHTHL